MVITMGVYYDCFSSRIFVIVISYLHSQESRSILKLCFQGWDFSFHYCILVCHFLVLSYELLYYWEFLSGSELIIAALSLCCPHLSKLNRICAIACHLLFMSHPHLSKLNRMCTIACHFHFMILVLPSFLGYSSVRCQIDGYSVDLKLQKGEKAKKERKEKKREKKEKERKNGEIEKKQSHKRRHKHKRCQDDETRREHRKRGENETEQLEKSSLTEEHGHPAGLQNLCDSSDSTLNSNKRQKLTPNGRHNLGSIIRIRLPLQKHKDPDVLSSKEEPCSTSVNNDIVVQEKNEYAHRPGEEGRVYPCSSSTTTTQDLTSTSGKEMRCPSPGAFKIFTQRPKTILPSSLYASCSPPEVKFRELLESWISPPSEDECTEFNDEEWLFPTKQNPNCGAKGFKAVGDGSSCELSTPWPHVCYLPEVDIHVLPFTVPF